MPTRKMDQTERKIQRLMRIPGLLNWARQNFPRTDETRAALQKLADAELTISLGAIYALCAKVAYRELTYDEAFDKALHYKKFHREAATEILPLFQDYLVENQVEALAEFRRLRAPFPIGRTEDGKTSAIPVRPTFVAIRQGRLHPVFLLGWVDSPLSYHQKRLISAVVRRAVLSQQDFRGSDAEVVSFPRYKGHKIRYRGGWMISSFADFSDDELADQIRVYNDALKQVIAALRGPSLT